MSVRAKLLRPRTVRSPTAPDSRASGALWPDVHEQAQTFGYLENEPHVGCYDFRLGSTLSGPKQKREPREMSVSKILMERSLNNAPDERWNDPGYLGSDYVLLAAQDASWSVTGACFVMLLVSVMGGAIPAAALLTEIPEGEALLLLALAWVWHWILAGIMVWGLLAALVPVWCFYELLHGRKNAGLVLGVAFAWQLVLSTFCECLMDYGTERMRPIGVSLGVLIILAAMCGVFYGRRSHTLRPPSHHRPLARVRKVVQCGRSGRGWDQRK